MRGSHAHDALKVKIDKYVAIISKLFSRIASVIQRNLHLYKPVEVARITQALFLMQYQNPELFTKLRNILNK